MKTNLLRVRWACSLMVLVLSASCAPLSPRVLPKEEKSAEINSTIVQTPDEREHYVLHRVTYFGETLPAIAKWYTGEARNWPTIRSATPWLKSETLATGDLVLIPASLAVQTAPFDKKYISEMYGGSDLTADDSNSSSNHPNELHPTKLQSHHLVSIRHWTDYTPPPPATPVSLSESFAPSDAKVDPEKRKLLKELLDF